MGYVAITIIIIIIIMIIIITKMIITIIIMNNDDIKNSDPCLKLYIKGGRSIVPSVYLRPLCR